MCGAAEKPQHHTSRHEQHRPHGTYDGGIEEWGREMQRHPERDEGEEMFHPREPWPGTRQLTDTAGDDRERDVRQSHAETEDKEQHAAEPHGLLSANVQEEGDDERADTRRRDD